MKKGMTWNFIVYGALAVGVLVLMYYFLGQGSSNFGSTMEDTYSSLHKKACESGDIMSEAKDCDRDGHPDYCDRCIDGATTGSMDGDRMPDVCETEEGKETDEIICKYKEKGAEDKKGFKCSRGPDCGNDLDECPNTYTLQSEKCPNNELAVEEMVFVKHGVEE